MKKLLFPIALLLGAAMAFRRLVPPEGREKISEMRATMRDRMAERMGRMMEQMPDDSPPKLFMSTMSRLQEQNDELLALMREQNTILREQLRPRESSNPGSPSAAPEPQQGHSAW
jgi:hypothetical protein